MGNIEKEKLKRRAVYIGDQWDLLKKESKKQKVTRSALVREAIKKVYKV